jgi:hypothetical protein
VAVPGGTRMTAVVGVDVSHYQTSEKLASVIRSGAKFVIVKATQGAASVDTSHGLHVATGRAGGIAVGHYHFAQAVAAAVAEADFFLATASPQPGDALALDLEQMDGSWPARVAYAVTWLQHVHARTGAYPLVYMNGSWLSAFTHAATSAQLAILRSYPLWIATGGKAPGQPGVTNWDVHQYSTAGGIDHDLLAPGVTWASFAIPIPKPPAPAPTVPLEGDVLRYLIPGSKQQVLILCGKQTYLNSAAGLSSVPLSEPDASTVANYATTFGPIQGTKNP